jgi:hypothetical protein
LTATGLTKKEVEVKQRHRLDEKGPRWINATGLTERGSRWINATGLTERVSMWINTTGSMKELDETPAEDRNNDDHKERSRVKGHHNLSES